MMCDNITWLDGEGCVRLEGLDYIGGDCCGIADGRAIYLLETVSDWCPWQLNNDVGEKHPCL